MTIGREALVVGGGLAGISAALRLADDGWRVRLLESRPRLGGAVYSFSRHGLVVDTGQHVFLRCYTAYRELLRRLGTADLAPLQRRLDIPVIGRGAARLRGTGGLPAGLHLLPALARYRPLRASQRLGAIRTAAALGRVDPDDPCNDEETFGHWLRRHAQSLDAVRDLWGVICVAALNLDPDQASLALAARVFGTGLLHDAHAADIGVMGAPLSTVHADAADRLFARLGVRVFTGERVREVARPDQPDAEPSGGMVVRTADGEVTADAVVLAVPHHVASMLVPVTAVAETHRWAGLGSSPIVNVHLHYDRRVLPYRFAAVLDDELQWLFDRSAQVGSGWDAPSRQQYIVSSLSAADGELAMRTAQIVSRQHAALVRVLPDAARARVLDSFVTREPRATFRQRPGTAGLRPPPATRWPELALAGAWTATGWPDTMEGAVVSGIAAADALATGYQSTAHPPGHQATSDRGTEMIA